MKRLLILSVAVATLAACDSRPSGGLSAPLTPADCNPPPLDPPAVTGAPVDVDGTSYLLRDTSGLYTSREVLEATPWRSCPECIGGACVRHFEDADCSLLPVRREVPLDPRGETVTGVTVLDSGSVLVDLSDGRSFTVVSPCGCDLPEGYSSGLILCPNGDAWDPLEIVGA